VTDRETYDQFWEESVTSHLHPTQILILEAVARLGLPVSASIMVHLSSGTIPLANCSYHLRQLETREILMVADAGNQKRNSEKFFCLRHAGAE
jgi:hypothetical protein